MAIGVGYLVGTFPTADIVARQASGGSINLRQTGSRNPGGANAMNVLGAKAGIAVMVGDIGKGALACCAGALVAGPPGAHLAGTASVVGHCYPVWSGFTGGGKGVACSVGPCDLPCVLPDRRCRGRHHCLEPEVEAARFRCDARLECVLGRRGCVLVGERLAQPVGPEAIGTPAARSCHHERDHCSAIPRRRSTVRAGRVD
jgi:hypothetical protein